VRNFDETLALVEEILLEPRWDEEEFSRIKIKTINEIKRSDANPNVVAGRVYNKILYGENHIFSYPISGTVASVEAITIEDLKTFYYKNFSPSISNFHIVGAITELDSKNNLASIGKKWAAKEVVIPSYLAENNRDKASLYFVDIPGAKQSVLNIGYISMARTDKDFYSAEVMNYKLGGSFSGNVNLILREEKGYTYGARTGFNGSKIKGTFKASSSVRTNTTGESVSIFKEQIADYKNGISQEDLDFTKNAMIKSNARRFETQFSLLGMLQEMSTYNLPVDYIAKEEALISAMTLEQHKDLANKYLDESKMAYVIIGDAATQFSQFKDMGFDEVMLMSKEGQEIEIDDVKM
jgi:zinc protease